MDSKGSREISINELSFRVKDIIARETQVIRAQAKAQRRRHIYQHIVPGLRSTTIVSWIIVYTDNLGSLAGVPREIIVGAGVVGLEYASFMAALGSNVTLIDHRPVVLDFVDRGTKR